MAQIFAVRNPDRVRSLTLTNCDVHDNLGPPESLSEVVPLAERGDLAPLISRMLDATDLARAHFPGTGFEDPALLTTEEVRELLGPAFSPPDGGRHFEHVLTSIRGDELTKIEPALRTLTAPTLMVWGTDDTYFGPHWARWLRDVIPGATEVIEIEGGSCSSHSSAHRRWRPRCGATGTCRQPVRWAGASAHGGDEFCPRSRSVWTCSSLQDT